MKEFDVDISIYKQEAASYTVFPYDPEEIYPEFSQFNVYEIHSGKKNENYYAVRKIFKDLGFDKENWGTSSWNPLKNKVKKGQNVVIKPNLVYHEHPYGDESVLSMITNAAVIRPIIDYILLATEGVVNICIGDAPVQGGDFDKACEISGIKKLVDFYKKQGIDIKVIDFRLLISKRNEQGILSVKYQNPKRQRSLYRAVDLKEKSELSDIASKSKRFEITDYGFGSVRKHHNEKKNEYIIPKEILEADLFINVPKLKTHRKAGVTCAMKNLVGINGDKTCIAHHTRGSIQKGGDEFNKTNMKAILRVRVWSFLKTTTIGIKLAGEIKRFFEKYVWHGQSLKKHNMANKPSVFFEGSWSGNDTIWRCVKDLNKIILYADKKGNMRKSIQREYLCIVDAVLAGEKEGPMEQTTKEFGVVFGGMNPVYVDYAATKLMKYDYKKIPLIRQGFHNRWWSLVDKEEKDVSIISNRSMREISQYFVPTFGWQDVLKETLDE